MTHGQKTMKINLLSPITQISCLFHTFLKKTYTYFNENPTTIVFLWRSRPTRTYVASLLTFLDHTQLDN
jgi:hypothetical protein